MSAVYPVTTASGKYSSMIARVRSNLLAVKSGRSARRARDPFFMDRGGPKRTGKVLISQTQKKITEAGGIQNVGVKQRRHFRASAIAFRVFDLGPSWCQEHPDDGTLYLDVRRGCRQYAHVDALQPWPAGYPPLVKQPHQKRSSKPAAARPPARVVSSACTGVSATALPRAIWSSIFPKKPHRLGGNLD